MSKCILHACFITVLILLTNFAALGVSVDQLEELTGGATPVVSFLEHDRFTHEYAYSVKVANQTGDPIVAGTLVLVIFEVLDLSGKDVLDRLEAVNKDGMTSGKPYFVIPSGGFAELPPYRQSPPITVRLRDRDNVSFFPPSFHVLGQRRKAEQSLEVLIQELKNKGVLSDTEAQEALRPLRGPAAVTAP